jgi:hypothetical protein
VHAGKSDGGHCKTRPMMRRADVLRTEFDIPVPRSFHRENSSPSNCQILVEFSSSRGRARRLRGRPFSGLLCGGTNCSNSIVAPIWSHMMKQVPLESSQRELPKTLNEFRRLQPGGEREQRSAWVAKTKFNGRPHNLPQACSDAAQATTIVHTYLLVRRHPGTIPEPRPDVQR